MSIDRPQAVLGGSGLMGQCLVRRLLEEGSKRVIIVDVKPPEPDILADSRVRFTRADVTGLDRQGIEDALEDAETLFYKIGKLGNPMQSSDVEQAWDYLAVNALAFARMMPALKKSRIRTVIVDSSITAVGDFARSSPVAELNGAGTATNFYGVSKAILEDLCTQNHAPAGLKIRVVRYPRVYSPTHAGFLVNFAKSIRDGKPIRLFGDTDKVLDLVHIDDAVETAFRCMGFEGRERIFHAAYGGARTLRQIVDMLCQEAGKPQHPIEFAEGVSPREPSSMSLADTYTSKCLGVKFRHSLETMIQDAHRTADQKNASMGEHL